MKNSLMHVGIAGVGRFGSRHLDKWQSFEDVQLVAFYDIDTKVRERVYKERGIPHLDLDLLLEKVDILDIVTPGSAHYEIARKAILAGKHIFVEKPFAEKEEQARDLLELAKEKQIKIGVGHIEHYNPVFSALKQHIQSVPQQVFAYRQGPFLAGVGLDISIILELMVHDIELVTQLIPYAVKSIEAEGEIVHSNKIDRATAVLEFKNGSRATLFASRAEEERRRELLCHTGEGLYRANLMQRYLQIPGGKQPLHFEANDAMAEELRDFLNAVKLGEKPPINEKQGLRAVSIANAIEAAILNKS